MNGEAVLEVDFKPLDKSVQYVRLMVNSWVLLATEDRALAGRVTVTCAELVDTATRRQAREGATIRLCVKLHRGGIRAETSSEVTEGEMRALEKTLQATGQGLPVEAYTRALADPTDGVQLGLARIRYEGQMELSARRQGPLLVLTARSRAEG